jgi:hypothetical protein
MTIHLSRLVNISRLVWGLSFIVPASASVIYSNITADSISPAASFYGTGGSGFEEAFSFVLAAGSSYTLDEIDVALVALNDEDPSAGNIADIFLYANSSGLPGSLLESFAVQVPPVYPPTTNSFTEVDSTLHPTLTGGSTYWIAVGPAVGSVSDDWLLDDTNDQGVFAFETSSTGPWKLNNPLSDPEPPEGPKAAFRILGTSAVPEPRMLPLILAALAIGILLRRAGSRRSDQTV